MDIAKINLEVTSLIGDYEVIPTKDSQVINRSKFMVQPEMFLEMSILMWQSSAFRDNKKCPHCSHLNLGPTARNGNTFCHHPN